MEGGELFDRIQRKRHGFTERGIAYSVFIATGLLLDKLNCVLVLFSVKCFAICDLTHFVFHL